MISSSCTGTHTPTVSGDVVVVVSWVSHYKDGDIMSSGRELTCSMGMPGNSRIAIEEQLKFKSYM